MQEDGRSTLDALLAKARSALKAAFGPAQVTALTPIGGGASGAFPFRADIGDRRYLVRVEGPASPLRNPHQYESMRIAAAAGIAPKLHFVDEAARVAVMDFVDERPMTTFPGGAPALAHAIGALLRRVQATQPFSPFVEYPEMVGRLWAWVCATGVFAPGLLTPASDKLERIRWSYGREPVPTVSSHNDPVPRNLLFDGTRLWLIDWESAYRNDPAVDVAITLDSFGQTPELAEALLRGYCGPTTDLSFAARLDEVRALTRLYYAGVFFSASAAALGPIEDRDTSALSLASLERAVRRGDLAPGSARAKHALGKMYLESFMTGSIPPGLDAAV